MKSIKIKNSLNLLKAWTLILSCSLLSCAEGNLPNGQIQIEIHKGTSEDGVLDPSSAEHSKSASEWSQEQLTTNKNTEKSSLEKTYFNLEFTENHQNRRGKRLKINLKNKKLQDPPNLIDTPGVIDDLGDPIYECDYKLEQLSCVSDDSNKCGTIDFKQYKCSTFISDQNYQVCLGITGPGSYKSRNVKLVNCHTQAKSTWIWRPNVLELRPISEPEHCLTSAGDWPNHQAHSFFTSPCNQDENQKWSFHLKSQAIVHKVEQSSSPITKKTPALDRYGNVIIWTYNSKSPKQLWLTYKQLMDTVKDQPDFSQIKFPFSDLETYKAIQVRDFLNMIDGSQGKPIPFPPDVSDYPGQVAENAPTVKRTFKINREFNDDQRILSVRVKNRVSTGLYAPAGKLIEIKIKNLNFQSGLGIRINSHTDVLIPSSPNVKNDGFKRPPQVSNLYHLASPSLKIRHPYGGLIYLESETNVTSEPEITISGAVQAPLIKEDTSAQEFAVMCSNPAPWGEIEGAKIVVTDITKRICSLSLNQLKQMINMYERDIEANEKFSGFTESRNHHKSLNPGKHRIVFDKQITAGYGHAGYPIMTHWNTIDAGLLTRGSWGNLHEIGHNYQQQCTWSRKYGTEVTVNIYTIFAAVYSKHPQASRIIDTYPKVIEKLKTPDYSYDNENDLFYKLVFHLQIAHEIGWTPFTGMMRYFRELSPEDRSKVCNSQQQQLDEYFIQLSKFSQIDLSEHFKTYKVGISQQAFNQVAQMKLKQPSQTISNIAPKSFDFTKGEYIF